ncbi:hypothetical protein [Anaerovorax sp. IOR16]|uniref:hypothetical protein n=1 Tax=Anaerovorax sp. IOR16 TaxID=2773458 RepID=UPI0019D19FDF|nr:hypothetical protein [Anaerovorax sp. IOR16]
MDATQVVDYGMLALIPPILAIGLAVWTKNIIVSLFVSIIVSTTILNGWNPVIGFTSMIKDYMFVSLEESMNTQALFMMVIIGGLWHCLHNREVPWHLPIWLQRKLIHVQNVNPVFG